MPAQRRNSFLEGLQMGAAMGDAFAPLIQAMKQRKNDAIANEFMNAQEVPRGRAVNPNAATMAADQQYADTPALRGEVKPFTGGAEGLKLQMLMEDRMAKRKTQGLSDELLAARVGDVKARTGRGAPPKIYEQQGGIMVVDPVTGKARFERPEGMPEKVQAPQIPKYDPIEQKIWERDLKAFTSKKENLNKTIEGLSKILAGEGRTFRRFSDPNRTIGHAEGKYYQATEGGEDVDSGEWSAWEQAQNARAAELKALQDQNAALQEPARPQPIGAAGAGDGIPTPRTPAEVAALPSGTKWRDPTGQVRIRP